MGIIMMEDDLACPRCKTTKYRNPSLKLMVNVCGHPLCESCVDLLFLKGSGACPECQIPLRRGHFRVQLYEDSKVEKEVDIRKRILRDFNKKEEDFKTQREYDDYLEEVENIIYNLTNNIDVPETTKKIERYKRENKELILKNKTKLGKKEHELEELIELEKEEKEKRRLELAKQELEMKNKTIRQKEALIDELMFSEGDAKNIVQSFASAIKASKDEIKVASVKATGFSTGIKFAQSGDTNFMSVPKVEEGPTYHYSPFVQDLDGPHVPDRKELQIRGFVNHVRSESGAEKAGGFRSNIACLKALQDAMASLHYTPPGPKRKLEEVLADKTI